MLRAADLSAAKEAAHSSNSKECATHRRGAQEHSAEIKGSGPRKLSQASFRKHLISQACSLAVATTRYAKGDLGTPLLDEDEAGCQGTGGGQATTIVPTPFTSSSMVPAKFER